MSTTLKKRVVRGTTKLFIITQDFTVNKPQPYNCQLLPHCSYCCFFRSCSGASWGMTKRNERVRFTRHTIHHTFAANIPCFQMRFGVCLRQSFAGNDRPPQSMPVSNVLAIADFSDPVHGRPIQPCSSERFSLLVGTDTTCRPRREQEHAHEAHLPQVFYIITEGYRKRCG